MSNLNEQIEYIKQNYPLFKNKTAKKEVRHNFFSKIETEIQAYILGILMSDGSVNEDYQIKLHINEKDKELFEYLKVISPEAGEYSLKGYESNAKTPDGRTVKNKGSVALYINSKILYEDLGNYGIVPNKTYKELSLPNLPNELMRHFIRGYFDGDGSFTYSVRKPNPKNREKNYRVTAAFNICGKLDNIFIEMQKWFASNNIKAGVYYEKRNDMYRLGISSRKCLIDTYNLLYNNSTCFLKRKFNKFSYYVNTEVNQLIADHRNAQEVNVNESNNPPKSVEHPTNEDENVR